MSRGSIRFEASGAKTDSQVPRDFSEKLIQTMRGFGYVVRRTQPFADEGGDLWIIFDNENAYSD